VGAALVNVSGPQLLGVCANTGEAACSSVPVNVRVLHFIEAAHMVGTPIPDGPQPNKQVVSGAVWLDINSTAAGATGPTAQDQLPCSPAGACRAQVHVPLSRYLPENTTLVCLRAWAPTIADLVPSGKGPGAVYTADANISSTYMVPAEWQPFGAVQCNTTQPGMYVVAAYTKDPLEDPVAMLTSYRDLDNAGWGLVFSFEGAATSFDSLVGPQGSPGADAFAAFVHRQVANTVKVPQPYVNVRRLTPRKGGGVDAHVSVWLPIDWSETERQAYWALLPYDVSSSFPTAAFLTQSNAAANSLTGKVAQFVETLLAHARHQVPLSIQLGIGFSVIIVAIMVSIWAYKQWKNAPPPRSGRRTSTISLDLPPSTAGGLQGSLPPVSKGRRASTATSTCGSTCAVSTTTAAGFKLQGTPTNAKGNHATSGMRVRDADVQADTMTGPCTPLGGKGGPERHLQGAQPTRFKQMHG
jgi:hypothetical protein